MTDRCDLCMFAATSKIHNRCECRRHAPIVIGAMSDTAETVWPSVLQWDWCGDFEGAPAK